MDPNKALAEIRAIVAKVTSDDYTGDEIELKLLDLANLVQGLDQWLSNRGFLPRAWQEGH
jgi:hypothetical protein